ncbi:laccase [Mycena vulgaris]|nr:laccase [Mycena vulgaris]
MIFSPLSIVLSLIPVVFAAIGPTAELTLTNAEVSPDGFPRQAVLVNGQVPGPLITANKNDEFNLNVVNSLTNETMLRSSTIHWHGFFQTNTSWADGVASVTQCPIAHNNSFLYTFQTGGQAGTFWWHSHLFYDPDDPHACLYAPTKVPPDTTVITLVDCTLGLVPTLVSTLINGLDRYAGGPTSQLAVISVTSGKRYRYDPNFTFTIDGHTMTIIEADSVNTEPLTVDSIQIFAGQRYSFVLTADQTVDNYWIRTVANGGTAGFDKGINSAILRYTNLHPLVPTPVPGTAVAGGADVAMNLALSLDITKGSPLDITTFKFLVNGETFTPPTVPVLLQILSGAQSATDLLPSGSVFPLPPNSVIELSIPGGSAGAPHPFHLHGHNFFVIKSAGNDTFNFDNPVIRDVVSTGPATTDNTTIRFVTDNAGPHIDFHLELGLAIVFAEDTATVAESTQTPAWDALCPAYNALPSDEL